MDYTLNDDQTLAADAFDAFVASDDTLFALLGYAGTGKSFMLGHLLRTTVSGDGETLIATPTHKATNIVRRFLTEQGIEHEFKYDRYQHQYGTPITGTTAGLLGIRPIITEEQTDKKRDFAKVQEGVVEKMPGVSWIVIDEVSMLSATHLEYLQRLAREIGAKIVAFGDPGQLPPVEEKPIDFEAIERKAVLQQIMRQQGDSAIPHLGRAIREQTDWTTITGPGVEHWRNPAGAFIDELEGVPPLDERERSVFVAYRNARVNAVQEAACQKVYGHGRLTFAPGETVVATHPLASASGKAMLVTNGDTLRIEEVGEQGEWGTLIRCSHINGGGFWTEFLNEMERADPNHPYNVELEARRKLAVSLQAEYKRDRGVDPERRAAWRDFYSLLESTVLSASHVFAITSHKSQGSTYRTVFVDAKDMAGFDRRALYVGATRPSEELIIG